MAVLGAAVALTCAALPAQAADKNRTSSSSGVMTSESATSAAYNLGPLKQQALESLSAPVN
jgi:hypothetical protein